MGCNGSKDEAGMRSREYVMELKEKVKLLREEISGVVEERKKEMKAYERDAMKEAERKEERKMLREEVKMLKKMVEEREEKLRAMAEEAVELQKTRRREFLRTSFLVEQMREERSRRDQAVEKWKQLYLAIKVELDDLVQRALHDNGDAPILREGGEEEEMRGLKMELKTKEETIKSLSLKLSSMAIEKCKKERDHDILRQSLRITSGSRKGFRIFVHRNLLPNHVVNFNY